MPDDQSLLYAAQQFLTCDDHSRYDQQDPAPVLVLQNLAPANAPEAPIKLMTVYTRCLVRVMPHGCLLTDGFRTVESAAVRWREDPRDSRSS